MGKLDGKVAVITGAGSGIGRAAAKLFAAEGARVAVAEISGETGVRTVREIAELGGTALFVQTDSTRPASLKASFAEAARHFGGLDILYNNTGGSSKEDGLVGATPPAAYERVLSFNFRSVWYACHFALPYLVARGGGAIINTSSSAALDSFAAGRHAYSAAKGAVISLTQAIAFDYARHKVRANVIAPGLTVTERIDQSLAEFPDMTEHLKPLHPLGNGRPDNVARLALYLACDESAFTTGQLFAVNSEVIG